MVNNALLSAHFSRKRPIDRPGRHIKNANFPNYYLDDIVLLISTYELLLRFFERNKAPQKERFFFSAQGKFPIRKGEQKLLNGLIDRT